MIDIKVLASGSTGNAYLVTDGRTSVLLECGISIKEIRRRLGLVLTDIEACLISHSHADHCKAHKDMARAGIDLYATQETFTAIGAMSHRAKVIQPGQEFQVGTWSIKSFTTQHDCPGSVGFRMANQGGERLVFITDSFYVRYRFRNITHWMIEVNYDAQSLAESVADGTTPTVLRDRLVMSHMSLDNAVDLLRANDLSKTEEIYAIHLSEHNANAERIKWRLMEVTGKPVFIAGGKCLVR